MVVVLLCSPLIFLKVFRHLTYNLNISGTGLNESRFASVYVIAAEVLKTALTRTDDLPDRRRGSGSLFGTGGWGFARTIGNEIRTSSSFTSEMLIASPVKSISPALLSLKLPLAPLSVPLPLSPLVDNSIENKGLVSALGRDDFFLFITIWPTFSRNSRKLLLRNASKSSWVIGGTLSLTSAPEASIHA